jgi:hypothetical protein
MRTSPEIEVARRIARFGIPTQNPTVDARDRNWSRVGPTLAAHRMTGLAMAAAEDGALILTGDQRSDLVERQKGAMLAALRLEKELLRVTDALARAGVRPVVLKGPALAHTLYPDPSWRPFGDIDLLVRTDQWREACDVLEELGHRRDVREPRPGFDERFGKGATHRNADDIEVDLHRTLVLGPFGLWLDVDELHDRAIPYILGGRSLLRLDDHDRVIHAAMHASLGSPGLHLWTVRDVAQTTLAPTVDWAILEERARRFRVMAVMRHALMNAATQLELTPPEGAEALLRYDAPRGERRALQTFVTARGPRSGTALSTLRAIPGLWAKLAYGWGILRRKRDLMRVRSGSPTSARRWGVPSGWLLSKRKARS